MSQLSREKREKIMSNILSTLYECFPQPLFTAEISKSEARDEEFVKSLLFELESKSLVKSIRKNPKGSLYLRRIRWTLTAKAHLAYKNNTNTFN